MLSTFFFWIGELDHSFPCQLWSNWLDWIISCHGKNVNKIKCTLCDKTALANFSFSLSTSVSSPICLFLLFWRGLARSAYQPPDTTDNISATIGWIAQKSYTDIHGTRRMNPEDVGDPQTIDFVPPWGWHLWIWVQSHRDASRGVKSPWILFS